MKLLIILFFLLSGCSNNTSSFNSSTINESSKDYKNYSGYYIELNEMYNIDKDSYVIYFYSSTCPACYDMKNHLFNYLDNSNKILDIFIINLFEVDEDLFNLFLKDDSLNYEEKKEKSINATKIEETYFIHTPSLYFISKINNINTLNDIYYNFYDIQSFFIENKKGI